MRQRYLRLISALLLLAVLAACGTDREGAAGGTVEGVVNRNGDFLVLLTDEGEYQTFEFGAGVDTGALEEGDCVSVTYTGELGKEDSTPTAVSISNNRGEGRRQPGLPAGHLPMRNQGLSALCLKSRKGAVSFP